MVAVSLKKINSGKIGESEIGANIDGMFGGRNPYQLTYNKKNENNIKTALLAK